MYYASRTLPNFFAFGLGMIATPHPAPLLCSPDHRANERVVTIALGYLLRRPRTEYSHLTNNPQKFLLVVTVTGIIFRSELALFLIPHTLLLLLTRRLSVTSIIQTGLLGLLIGLAITIPIDSFFWQRFPLWPELSTFSYNILDSQSSNWGTSPWHFYSSSALPRLLFNPLIYILCIPLAISQPALRQPVAELLLPNLAFVAMYSLQPHKEWRFIVYTLPPLLTAAALGANWIWTRRSRSAFYRLGSVALVISVLASFAASTIMLAISRLNYPGAEALHRLHAIAPQYGAPGQGVHGESRTPIPTINVHMGTLACMTGITRFQQLPAPPLANLERGNGRDVEQGELFWIYDKTDDEETLLTPIFWERFDWVLAEDPKRVIGKWEVVDTVDAYAGLRLLRPGDVGSGVNGGDVQRDVDVDGGGSTGNNITTNLTDLIKTGDLRGLWAVLEKYGRVITRGWWLAVKTKPRISILKRQTETPLPFAGD
ncbi:MAG: hypothetical protein Q9168_004252, partial [Polycauliona sp. 1 TL-2023]